MKKIDLIQSPVVFCENPHGYRLGDRRLSGITSLIHDVLGLGVYPDASDFVRKVAIPRAGEYGTAVHHAIETYDNLGIRVTEHPKSERFRNGIDDDVWDVSAELDAYIEHRKGYEPLANEYTVSDEERYASNIDNVWVKTETEGIWLVDTKTNNLDLYPGGPDALKEYLSWQLSIYAVLFEEQNPGLKVEGLACNWLRKGESAFWTISRKPDEDVKRLLSTKWVEIDGRIIFDLSEREDARPKPEAVAPIPKADIVPTEVVQAIYDIEKRLKELEAMEKEMKAKLREAMENNEIKSWDSGIFKATIAADSTARTFDSKRFKAEHPDLYEQYLTTTQKKGGFTIKLI